jgi:SpoIID/LytB domain protein
MEAPHIKVGIFTESEVVFTINSAYRIENQKTRLQDRWTASNHDGIIHLRNGDENWMLDNEVSLMPISPEGTFCLHEVTIGVGFHWERKEDQIFKGGLLLKADKDKIIAINVLPVEDYLMSVISSEMRATSSEQLLKAHAVISRSWLLAQIVKNKDIEEKGEHYQSFFEDDAERVRWYDREDHLHFDVCADDHCQRYQGITRANTQQVEEAVKATEGEVLVYNNAICDARFSKCCGGIAEVFENVWEPVNHPYLQMVIDNPESPNGFSLDLTHEENARKWILGSPEAFCNSSDKKVLQQVLNDYDQETNDFFRWKVEYTQEELSELVKQRTGIDFGLIIGLIPVERGVSGRLIKLKVVGTKKVKTIGKELEIRKALSKSHLYSSAFVVDKQVDGDEVKYVLSGAGWGHGVGLCQIGAAMMGDKGYSYEQILLHYFRGAAIEKWY